jgi:hypothetical protein
VIDPAVERARTQLGEQAFAVAWEAGRAMPLDQAIAYALEGSAVDAEQPAGAGATSKNSQ